jgi:hypothetical protein
MKKIILLLLSLQAIKPTLIPQSPIPRAPFEDDNTLTENQKNAMRGFRSKPNEISTMGCKCTKCREYLWDTCNGHSWVKGGVCSQAGWHNTLPECS